MRRVGTAKLWLVDGGVPHFDEMVELGGAICRAIVEEAGPSSLIERLGSTHWLSCLACALGFEWDTSGQTTVTLAALKRALSKIDVGVKIVGGKGLEGRKIRGELREVNDSLKLGEEGLREIEYSSVFSCKVDNAALQDSHVVYFHAVAITSDCDWCVINQGMNVVEMTARRYHWIKREGLKVEEPHSCMSGSSEVPVVLDMTSKGSAECRSVCVDLVRDGSPIKIQRELERVRMLMRGQATLDIDGGGKAVEVPRSLRPPRRIDLGALSAASESVNSFEDLLTAPGVGAATIRGLAYIASLIYGSPPSWRDPVRYAYAHGTKSGRPYYLDKESMRREAEMLRAAVEEAKVGKREKMKALRRLSEWFSQHIN